MASTHKFSTLAALQDAVDHLKTADPRLHGLIADFGVPERLLTKTSSCFVSLAKSILYQQLAGSAAAAIYSRFLSVCGVPSEESLTPQAVLSVELPLLRGCGLSERKAQYLQELATHFSDGRLSDELLQCLAQDELQAALTAVRGIGPWTVDMHCMFHRGMPDILPIGDLGVRKGLAQLNGLSHLPSPAEMEQLTAAWRPYRSVGCYYMWRIPVAPKAKAKQAPRSSSSAAKRKKQAAVNKSPLGAAMPAVADVGVNPAAPMLAAAAGGTPVTAAIVPAAVAARTIGGAGKARAGSSSGSNSPDTAAAAGDGLTGPAADGDASLLPITPAKLLAPPAAAAAAVDGAAAGCAVPRQGMMTRRQLYKARNVDL